ncbi:hypothetical protein M752DRAFT_278938 [Aspergillus phoenicis ATCC 13157]|uniref:Uncharacterized protein n=1 Tax=Aspergillus phoenicis ATCC 13157 TaxID=1353007 RepID=A0A370P987_ASPPH|nr:hypothetical protein M752DRAFT_278938 [Aspergillus phoenicis ATCC 13157]
MSLPQLKIRNHALHRAGDPIFIGGASMGCLVSHSCIPTTATYRVLPSLCGLAISRTANHISNFPFKMSRPI